MTQRMPIILFELLTKTKRECEFVIHLLKKNYLPKQFFLLILFSNTRITEN